MLKSKRYITAHVPISESDVDAGRASLRGRSFYGVFVMAENQQGHNHERQQ
jgi:hypothetical protein